MTLRTALLSVAGLMLATVAAAQGAKKPPLPIVPLPSGTPVAPQGSPSPDKVTPTAGQSYEEWMKEYYQIFTIPKKDAIRLGGGRVRPHPLIGVVLQIVGEDDQNLFIRNLPPEDPDSAAYGGWARQQREQVVQQMKEEYFKDKYLIVDAPDVPPPFTDKVSFTRRDEGLPRSGRWQMSFDVADMNGDGLPDLVLPPQRTGEPTPYIFVQQKDGSWKQWQDVKWPTEGIKLDYGTVRVADFDGDGRKDIAIACHIGRTYVLYGGGKGDFTRFTAIPQVNSDVTSRCLTVADFNGDGRPDLATLAEIDIMVATTERFTSGLINVALNLPSGWKAIPKGFFPEGIQGDWISAADIDKDGLPDLLLTSRAQNVLDLVFRNVAKGEKWEPVASLQIPVNSYVFANAAAPLDRFKQPDVVECFEQWNPWKVEPPTQACAVFHFHDARGKPTLKPTPVVLFQEKVEYKNYKAVAVGDIDGDGRNDIVVANYTGQVRVFLQGSDGRFYEQRSPGLDLPGTDVFDVRIVDLDGDGKGEVVVMGAPSQQGGGGVWVFRPGKPGATALKTP